MAVSPRKRGLDDDERRALRMLVGRSHGCTEAMMLAHGFTTEMLVRMVRDRLAVTMPGMVRTGRRQTKVVWVVITDAGRQALAGDA
jgi:hypothetical protein